MKLSMEMTANLDKYLLCVRHCDTFFIYSSCNTIYPQCRHYCYLHFAIDLREIKYHTVSSGLSRDLNPGPQPRGPSTVVVLLGPGSRTSASVAGTS